MSYLVRILLILICSLSGPLPSYVSPDRARRFMALGRRPEVRQPACRQRCATCESTRSFNQQLPLDLVFRDESGQEVKLGKYFGLNRVVSRSSTTTARCFARRF
jgi:hypothetical protein